MAITWEHPKVLFLLFDFKSNMPCNLEKCSKTITRKLDRKKMLQTPGR